MEEPEYLIEPNTQYPEGVCVGDVVSTVGIMGGGKHVGTVVSKEEWADNRGSVYPIDRGRGQIPYTVRNKWRGSRYWCAAQLEVVATNRSFMTKKEDNGQLLMF